MSLGFLHIRDILRSTSNLLVHLSRHKAFLAVHQVLPCTRSLRQRVDGCDKVWRVGETRMSLTTQRIVTGVTSQVTDSQLTSAFKHLETKRRMPNHTSANCNCSTWNRAARLGRIVCPSPCQGRARWSQHSHVCPDIPLRQFQVKVSQARRHTGLKAKPTEQPELQTD